MKTYQLKNYVIRIHEPTCDNHLRHIYLFYKKSKHHIDFSMNKDQTEALRQLLVLYDDKEGIEHIIDTLINAYLCNMIQGKGEISC